MLNHIVIMGRLTRDPELRYTQSQTPVASFTVAVDRDYTDQSGTRGVDFIDCVVWRSGAEFVNNYFRKGQMIVIDGRLASRKWEDRDGNKRTAWEVIAEHAYFGESKRDSGTASSSGNYQTPPGSTGNPYSLTPSSYSNAAQPMQQTFTDLGDDDGDLPF